MRDKDRYWDCLDQAMEASHGGRTEEALAWLDEALKAHPNGAEAHNGRGEILWDAGRIDEALYELELATMADPKFMTAHLNRIELLIEELGEYEHALQLCDELLAGRPELPRPDRGTEAEIHYLKAKALFYLDDLEGALFLVRRAAKVAPDVPVYRAFEGQILFEIGALRGGAPRARAGGADGLGVRPRRLPPRPRARAPRRGRGGGSRLPPRERPRPRPLRRCPCACEDAVFQRASEDALANLPRSIREAVENVPILIHELPEEDLLDAENVSPTILGLFIGVPRTEAALTEQARDVNRVILFKKNLEKMCRTRAELVEQIQTTLQHEIGHYLGLDDDDLERIGLA